MDFSVIFHRWIHLCQKRLHLVRSTESCKRLRNEENWLPLKDDEPSMKTAFLSHSESLRDIFWRCKKKTVGSTNTEVYGFLLSGSDLWITAVSGNGAIF